MTCEQLGGRVRRGKRSEGLWVFRLRQPRGGGVRILRKVQEFLERDEHLSRPPRTNSVEALDEVPMVDRLRECRWPVGLFQGPPRLIVKRLSEGVQVSTATDVSQGVFSVARLLTSSMSRRTW